MAIDFSKYGMPVAKKTGGTDFSKYGTPAQPINNTKISTEPNEKESFLGGIVRAPLTILARPFQAVAELAGAKSEDVDRITSKLTGGIVAPVPQNLSDVKKDSGRALQTVALGLNPAAGGAAFGVGNSLEQGNNLFSGQTALQTALGAIGGKTLDVLGKPVLNGASKILGSVVPDSIKNAVGQGIQKVSDYAEKTKLLPDSTSKLINKGADAVNKVFDTPFNKAGSALEERAIKSNIKDWERQSTKSRAARDVIEIAKQRGNPSPAETLTKRGLNPVKIMANGDQELVADTIRKETADLSKKALGPTLREAQIGKPLTHANSVEEGAVNRIAKDVTPDDMEEVANSIKNKVESLRNKYPDGMTYEEMQYEKGVYDANTRFGVTEDTRIKGQANKAIGSQLRSMIEESVPGDMIKNFNKIQSHQYAAADYLDALTNKNHRGGLLRSLLRKATSLGGSVGGHLISGGAGGELSGYLLGNGLSHLFDDVSNPVKAMILRNLKYTDLTAYNALVEYTGKKEAQRLEQLALPEGAKLGSSGNPIIAPEYKGGASGVVPNKPMAQDELIAAQKATGTYRPLLGLPVPTSKAEGEVIKLRSAPSIENKSSNIRDYSYNPKDKKYYQKGKRNGGN